MGIIIPNWEILSTIRPLLVYGIPVNNYLDKKKQDQNFIMIIPYNQSHRIIN